MDPIIVTDLNITGRVTERDARLGNVFVTYNMDLSGAANYVFQFGIQSQMQTFGVVKSLFLDNGSNPADVEVSVSGTDQFFTVPAYSIGIYTVDANQGSNISVVTAGGATDICTITFYNWERPPVVWYSFGPFNSNTPLKTYGTMDEGDTVATEPYNEPVFIGGIDRGTGQFRGIKVDALGRLDFSSSISIGGVFGADPMGAAPVNPGVVQAVRNSAGNLVYVQLNAAGEFLVTDGPANTKLTALQALITATNLKLDVLVENTDKAVIGTQSIVVSTAADTIILASNAARQGATIFNDSTAILYLLLANAVSSLTVYSVQIAAGGYYEVPAKYTGIIKGIWAAANGNARVTELV
jgi:hypothetical protein